ncbi:cold shock domain-containing protein [Fibrisoma limi]|nr:cold shock domain-containing protein [Fibrisoma limi]
MDTFSKKEKEKQRQKKKKDKQEKREDRKANAQKGQSLDQMLAYVDENGNITTTPPDPNRKREVNQEEIQIGVPRQDAMATEEVTRRGIVTSFNTSKGYGFIRDQQTQESIFVHVNALKEPISERDKVTFSVEMTPKGLNAINVKKAV